VGIMVIYNLIQYLPCKIVLIAVNVKGVRVVNSPLLYHPAKLIVIVKRRCKGCYIGYWCTCRKQCFYSGCSKPASGVIRKFWFYRCKSGRYFAGILIGIKAGKPGGENLMYPCIVMIVVVVDKRLKPGKAVCVEQFGSIV